MCFQLRPLILILSRGKINLTFGTGHVTWYRYIFYAFDCLLSYVLIPSWTVFTLACSYSLRHFATYYFRNAAENRTSKKTFIIIRKLVYLPHYSTLYVSQNHLPIQIHTFSYQGDEYFPALYFLVFFSAHTNSHVRAKHLHSHNICISDTHPHSRIMNKQQSNIFPILYCFCLVVSI